MIFCVWWFFFFFLPNSHKRKGRANRSLAPSPLPETEWGLQNFLLLGSYLRKAWKHSRVQEKSKGHLWKGIQNFQILGWEPHWCGKFRGGGKRKQVQCKISRGWPLVPPQRNGDRGWRGLHGGQEGFRLLVSSGAKHGHLLLLTVSYMTKMCNCKKPSLKYLSLQCWSFRDINMRPALAVGSPTDTTLS